ncbi:MAG TPA: response regulator [Candidatus Obscuribacterales bacterium]
MPRLLIVDDDRGLLALLEDWLTSEKHEVTAVHNGTAAWNQLETQEYDLIVMDWDLPDVPGIDIVTRFRAAGGITPVIMLTGHTSVADKEAGLDAGANDYLTKPFHAKELSARIRAVLRTQSARPPAPKALGEGNEEVLRAANLVGTALAARYEILDVIGSGSTAMVLKARHPALDRLVAVKLFFPGLFARDRLERFKWEVRTMSEVHHDNIATVYDCGVTEREQPYLVMDYVRGEALRERMAREKQLQLSTAITILIQVCWGVQQAHDKGIVHGDLRPENILLQEGGERADWVKVVDFGVAWLVTPSSLRLKRADTSIRTAEYRAPERDDGAIAVIGWDIYALGVMLYEMLTGRLPFEAAADVFVIISAMLENIEPPSSHRQDIAPGSTIDQLVLKATEKSPELRYQTAAELRVDLEKALSELMQRQ